MRETREECAAWAWLAPNMPERPPRYVCEVERIGPIERVTVGPSRDLGAVVVTILARKVIGGYTASGGVIGLPGRARPESLEVRTLPPPEARGFAAHLETVSRMALPEAELDPVQASILALRVRWLADWIEAYGRAVERVSRGLAFAERRPSSGKAGLALTFYRAEAQRLARLKAGST